MAQTEKRPLNAKGTKLGRFLLAAPVILVLSQCGVDRADSALEAEQAGGARWITACYTNGSLALDNIPWKQITHIQHFRLNLLNELGDFSGIKPRDARKLTAAAHQAGVKALIVFYGGAEYLPLAMRLDPGGVARKIAAFVTENNYDGVDFDFESQISAPAYAELIGRVRAALGPSKLLTIDVYQEPIAEPLFRNVLRKAGAALDRVNLMCYDMDSDAAGYIWYNGPISRRPNEDVHFGRSCGDAFAYYREAGTPAWKINIGIPFYGTIWTGCADAACQDGLHNLEQTWSSHIYNRGRGYNELVQSRWWSYPHQWDEAHKASYISVDNPGASNDAFVSFTDERQIRAIVNWGNHVGVGGFMEFELPLDFMPHETGEARHPLVAAVYHAVMGEPAVSEKDGPPVMAGGPVH